MQFIKHNIPDIYSLYRPAFQWQRCSGPHWESVKKSLGSGNSIDVSICCFFLFFFAFFFFFLSFKASGHSWALFASVCAFTSSTSAETCPCFGGRERCLYCSPSLARVLNYCTTAAFLCVSKKLIFFFLWAILCGFILRYNQIMSKFPIKLQQVFFFFPSELWESVPIVVGTSSTEVPDFFAAECHIMLENTWCCFGNLEGSCYCPIQVVFFDDGKGLCVLSEVSWWLTRMPARLDLDIPLRELLSCTDGK